MDLLDNPEVQGNILIGETGVGTEKETPKLRVEKNRQQNERTSKRHQETIKDRETLTRGMKKRRNPEGKQTLPARYR